MSWGRFSREAPGLAAFARGRLHGRTSYLATTRRDGSPRVHPVTPIIDGAQLYLFMEPTSPKGHDLRRGSRYALHAGVEDSSGGLGEVLVVGRAEVIHDARVWARASGASTYTPKEHYVLFQLDVDEALATRYEDGVPQRQRWQAR